MAFLAPLGGLANGDSRSLLLEALVSGPLTAKQAYSRVRKAGGKVTYQAVHKALGELARQGVVQRSGNNYVISVKWLGGVERFASSVRASSSLPVPGFYSFESPYAAEKFVIDFFLNLNVRKRPVMVLGWSHFWMPLFIDEYQKIRSHELSEKYDMHAVSYGTRAIDKWCDKFWAKNGLKTRIGVPNLHGDVVAASGYVAIFYYPAELRKQVDLLYSNKRSPAEFDTRAFFQRNFASKDRTFVSLILQSEFCKQVQVNILARFSDGVVQ